MLLEYTTKHKVPLGIKPPSFEVLDRNFTPVLCLTALLLPTVTYTHSNTQQEWIWPDSKTPHKYPTCLRRKVERREDTFRSLTSLKPTSERNAFIQMWIWKAPNKKLGYQTPYALCSPGTKQSAVFPRGSEYIKALSHSSHSLSSGKTATNKPIIPLWWPHPTSQIQVWK